MGSFAGPTRKKGRYGKSKQFKNNDGSWDSKDEYRRFLVLRDLEKKGTITDLETKVEFSFNHNGHHIAKFKPDFRFNVNGRSVIEDYKGNVITRDFKLRCRMLKAFYGLDVVIVTNPGDVSHIMRLAEGN